MRSCQREEITKQQWRCEELIDTPPDNPFTFILIFFFPLPNTKDSSSFLFK